MNRDGSNLLEMIENCRFIHRGCHQISSLIDHLFVQNQRNPLSFSALSPKLKISIDFDENLRRYFRRLLQRGRRKGKRTNQIDRTERRIEEEKDDERKSKLRSWPNHRNRGFWSRSQQKNTKNSFTRKYRIWMERGINWRQNDFISKADGRFSVTCCSIKNVTQMKSFIYQCYAQN